MECSGILVAGDEGVVLACSHTSRAHAQRMVEYLHRYGLDFARVVEGVCGEANEWNR